MTFHIPIRSPESVARNLRAMSGGIKWSSVGYPALGPADGSSSLMGREAPQRVDGSGDADGRNGPIEVPRSQVRRGRDTTSERPAVTCDAARRDDKDGPHRSAAHDPLPPSGLLAQ